MRFIHYIVLIIFLSTISNAQEPDELIIGQSADLTGFFAAYGRSITNGINACFEQINGQGGINGKNIKLITLDDQGSAKKTQENIEILLKKKGVTILLGTMGTRGILGSLNLLKEQKPLVLFSWGYDKQFDTFPFIIPGFPSINQQIDALLQYCHDELGYDGIGIFKGDDSFSTNAAIYASQKAPHLGIQIKGTGTYNRFTLSIRDATEPLIKADPRAILCIATSSPATFFINRLLREGKFGITFLSVDSGLFITPILENQGVNIHLSSLVPPLTSSMKLMTSYRDAMHHYVPQEPLNILSCAYYCAARVLVEAIRQSTGEKTKDDIYKAITLLQNPIEEFPIAFNPKTKHLWEHTWIINTNTGNIS